MAVATCDGKDQGDSGAESQNRLETEPPFIPFWALPLHCCGCIRICVRVFLCLCISIVLMFNELWTSITDNKLL